MIRYDFEQRTPEWYAIRAGRVTGTAAIDVLATVKKGEAAARRDLKYRLIVERLTGQPQDDGNGFVNAAMQRGIDKEAEAVAAYEAATGNLVRRTGFLAHDDLAAGCSLDGDIDDFTGIVEVKCPKSATHIQTIQAGAVPSCYLPQITHGLWISGAAWCDFVSFDDRFPPDLAVFMVRVRAEDLDLAAYELVLRQFLREVDAEYQAVEALRAKRSEVAV